MDYKYHCVSCFKTIISDSEPGEEARMCNCTPPQRMLGTPYVVRITPLSPALREEFSPTEASKLRATLCSNWGITSKTHVSHGSNFSSNQTLKNLIDDITDVVSGEEEFERIRLLVIRDYDYDIRSGLMA